MSNHRFWLRPVKTVSTSILSRRCRRLMSSDLLWKYWNYCWASFRLLLDWTFCNLFILIGPSLLVDDSCWAYQYEFHEAGATTIPFGVLPSPLPVTSILIYSICDRLNRLQWNIMWCRILSLSNLSKNEYGRLDPIQLETSRNLRNLRRGGSRWGRRVEQTFNQDEALAHIVEFQNWKKISENKSEEQRIMEWVHIDLNKMEGSELFKKKDIRQLVLLLLSLGREWDGWKSSQFNSAQVDVPLGGVREMKITVEPKRKWGWNY